MPQTLSMQRSLLTVISGGFLGTLARYQLSLLLQHALGKSWPYDILLINISGALILALVNILARTTSLIGPTRHLFIGVGFLGAYTTFSSLALGATLLFRGGNVLPALLYLLLSTTGGILAVLMGEWLGNVCVRKISQSSFHWLRIQALPVTSTVLLDEIEHEQEEQ